MAGKKKGVGGVEEEDVKPVTPEEPKSQVTLAAEAPKPNPTPEGEDTYTSQLMFGQKTYDQQMKTEQQFAGLNRTDEISQLGGASKLEVDLAQMKIFSTERIGDDLYAAIQRGDTHKVEAMAGLNSDRRLTEAQILVLLKAKHEAENDEAKRIANDAYIAAELGDKRKFSDDDEIINRRADLQNQRTAAAGGGNTAANAGEPQYYETGWDDDGNFYDASGGRTDAAGIYHDRFGGQMGEYGVYQAADGDIVTDNFEYDNQTGEARFKDPDGGADVVVAPIKTTSTGEPVNEGTQRVAALITATDQQETAGAERKPGLTANEQSTLAGTAPQGGGTGGTTPLANPPAGDSRGQMQVAAAAAGTKKAPALPGGAAAAAAHYSAENQLLVDNQPIKDGPGKKGSLELWDDARKRNLEQATRELGRATTETARAAAQLKVDKFKDTRSEAYIDYLRDTSRSPLLSAAERATYEQAVTTLESKLPAARGLAQQGSQERQAAAAQNIKIPQNTDDTPTQSNLATTQPPVNVDVSKLNNTDDVFETYYDENGFYHDEKGGYFDNIGGYYDKDGGYRDNDGTYYAADGGIFDKNGGYEWPDGSYEDAHGNYVDKDGNLYAVDGTVLKAEDLKDEGGGGWKSSYKRMLQDAAEKDKTVNPFDPATGPSDAKTAAFVDGGKTPSWANKTEEEKAAWRVTSSYFKNESYLEVASLPVWDPMQQNYNGNTLNPLAPSNQPQLA